MRIRSCHPEQWTDDAFVQCTALARLLALGLRNVSDDNGIFEWNPYKLKVRLLPADNCDINALLGELEQTKQVMRFTAEGRDFGMIRSFQRFQRPKKPSFSHPIPGTALPHGYSLSKAYEAPLSSPAVGNGPPTSSPPVPHQSVKVDAGVGVGVEGGVVTPMAGSGEPTAHAAASPTTKPRKSRAELRAEETAGFAALWAAWPCGDRKVDRKKCAELWRKQTLEPIADVILAHVESAKTSDSWQRGYHPKPETYLRNRRWEDSGDQSAATVNPFPGI
jgi:hypothetical protein